MRPIRLEATNFMPYKELDLDFTSFKIACLAGNNGSGKSSILDAMTWALWDKSRASSEDIIRLGEMETRVEFTFELEQQTYRIVRSKKRGKRGKSSLEFQIQSEAGYRPLTAKSIRKTQLKINDVLKMDYNLFIHSSFILQGKADAFTVSKPTERKQILAEILNLALYDRLQEQAKIKRDEVTSEQDQLKGQIQQILERLEELPQKKKDLKERQNAHKALLKALTLQQENFEDIEKNLQATQQKITRLKELENQYQTTSQEKQKLLLKIQEINEQLSSFKQLLAEESSIETGYKELQSLKEKKLKLTERNEQYIQLQMEHNQLLSQINAIRHKIDLDYQKYSQELSQLNNENKALERILSDREKILKSFDKYQLYLKQELEYREKHKKYLTLTQQQQTLEKLCQSAQHEQQMKLNQLNILVQERQKIVDSFPDIEQRLMVFRVSLERLDQFQFQLDKVIEDGQQAKSQIEQLNKQILLLNDKQSEIRQKIHQWKTHQHDASCPLCQQNLSSQDLQILMDKYQDDYSKLEAENSETQHQISAWEQKRQQHLERHKKLKNKLKQRDQRQLELGQLEKEFQDHKKAQEELLILKQEWEALQAKSSLEQLLPQESEQLNTIKQALIELAFEQNEFEVIQTRVKDGQWAESRHRELQQAEEKSQNIKDKLKLCQKTFLELEHQLQTKSFAQSEQERLKRFSLQIKELEMVPEELKQVKEWLSLKEPFESKWQAVQKARDKQQLFQDNFNAFTQDLEIKNKAIEILERDLAQLPSFQDNVFKLQKEQGTLKQQIEEQTLQEKNLYADSFALEQEVEQLLKEKEQLKDEKQQLKTLSHSIRIFSELHSIFGKKGIQAVIIENIIPEIEQAANDILSMMTDGRMHLRFQTLKTFKSSDRIGETLDILISDELGTRNYETYSAGEAFRVNFAIRLALSKFLARRAGAKLQMLVIDEGFGTQDQHGRHRIIEAINTIAHEFETIIVITHVDELKDLFQSRIEVIKHPQGSVIRMVA